MKYEKAVNNLIKNIIILEKQIIEGKVTEKGYTGVKYPSSILIEIKDDELTRNIAEIGLFLIKMIPDEEEKIKQEIYKRNTSEYS